MDPETNGSTPPAGTPADQPATPAPAAPAEPAAPAAAPTPPVDPATPADPAAPPADPATPAAPAASAEPRESGMQKRARELREKAAGQLSLADKLERDAKTAPAAPVAPAPAPTAPTPPQPGADAQQPDYFDPETGEIDPVKLNDFIEAKAEEKATKVVQSSSAQTELKAARDNYVASVDADAKAIVTEYPELDPANDSYDQELDDFLTEQYAQATTNSQGQVVRLDIPLKTFVDRQMKVIGKTRTKAAAQTPNGEAAAGTDGAIVPGNTPASPDKPFEELSIPEMEARLGKPQRR
jgi:hypothetical protein